MLISTSFAKDYNYSEYVFNNYIAHKSNFPSNYDLKTLLLHHERRPFHQHRHDWHINTWKYNINTIKCIIIIKAIPI